MENPASSPSPFWNRARHAARRPGLLIRARLKAAMRAHFEAQDFLEVETGIIQASPGNETHLHGFATEWIAPGEARIPGYLQTSPEFAMKKLLAAGESRIYQFAPVFRGREISALHAPEFTMLEWYRAGADYTALMADCVALLRLAAEIGGRDAFVHRGRECDPGAEPERLSLIEAFARHAGVDLEAMLEQDDCRIPPPTLNPSPPLRGGREGGSASAASPPPIHGGEGKGGGKPPSCTPPASAARDAFAAAARDIGIRVAPDDTWSDIFSRVLSEKIEPRLGIGQPTILDRYPVSEAALARPCPDDPRFAERFELYVCGVELANGFGELTDPAEQRRRFEADMAEKQRLYGERYPLDEDFLAALTHMPPASGIALGFDRLAMLAAGAERVEDVIFTPWPFTNPAV